MGRFVRPVRVEGDIAYVTLTKGYEAVIDAVDVPLVKVWNWRAKVDKRTVYAVRTDCSQGRERSLYMHRAIMADPIGLQIDHRDGDGLNCRRCNLREATHQQNTRNVGLNRRNSSGFKGVSWHKRDRKWRAAIKKDGKVLHLGYFDDPTVAHAAYIAASRELHCEFGRAA